MNFTDVLLLAVVTANIHPFLYKLVVNKKQYFLPATFLDHRQHKSGGKLTPAIDIALIAF